MGAMRSFWKLFVALALILPLGAFVAGTLVASAADAPGLSFLIAAAVLLAGAMIGALVARRAGAAPA